MKKITFILGLFALSTSNIIAQGEVINMGMGISTPEGNINMGIDIQETPDGGAIMNMNMTTPEGENINVGAGGGPKGVATGVNVQGSSTIQTKSTVTTTTTTTTHSTAQPMTVHPTSSARCSYAMAAGDFNNLLSSVKKQGFAEGKMSVIQQAAQANCVSVGQIKGLLKELAFEEDKLKAAKMLYHHTVDLNNFYQVNDVFSFDDSIEELGSYIESQR